MKKLALTLVALAAVAAVFLPIEGAEACARKNGRLVCGDSTTPVRLSGAVEVNNSLYPLDTTLGVTVDAGSPTGAALTVLGLTTLNGSINATNTLLAGTCTLNAASPAVCTATVRASCRPICTIQGGSAAIAAKGVACAVSSTTLTATSANAATDVVSYWCP